MSPTAIFFSFGRKEYGKKRPPKEGFPFGVPLGTFPARGKYLAERRNKSAFYKYNNANFLRSAIF